jgi:hypothetical protein
MFGRKNQTRGRPRGALNEPDTSSEWLIAFRRREKARVNRFITPDTPDADVLNDLRQRISPADPATWASLRELKMATAIPERSLQRIIADLRPDKSEVVIVPWRHRFAKTGAFPKRFAPRIVIGVLRAVRDQALFRLSYSRFGLTTTEKRIVDLTPSVIRSLSAKIARCH